MLLPLRWYYHLHLLPRLKLIIRSSVLFSLDRLGPKTGPPVCPRQSRAPRTGPLLDQTRPPKLYLSYGVSRINEFDIMDHFLVL
jgi:hypothetical protein